MTAAKKALRLTWNDLRNLAGAMLYIEEAESAHIQSAVLQTGEIEAVVTYNEADDTFYLELQ